MLSRLAYSEYMSVMENSSHRMGINVLKVSSMYSSINGMKKYGNSKKLNRHNAAAYVIARRGQGYKD